MSRIRPRALQGILMDVWVRRGFLLTALCLTALSGGSATGSNPSPAPSLAGYDAALRSTRLKRATVAIEGDELVVSTGRVEGRWQWTGEGLVTCGLKDLKTRREWITQEPGYAADWDLRLFTGRPELKALTAEVSTDHGLTSEHLRITAELEYALPQDQYPNSGLRVRFEIWAYPDAPGLRTQVSLGTWGQWVAPGIASSDDYRIDYLPLTLAGLQRQTVGFYNDHDGRNADEIDFVESQVISAPFSGAEDYPRANMVFFSDAAGGVAVVKESPKVVNKPGVNTGSFRASGHGVESTGWGAALAYLERDRMFPCWASWRICWDRGEEEKQLALKQFDRLRYPVADDAIGLLCNVWGGGQRGAGAKEANILREIESCAGLGIDFLQIDAGWQDDDPTTPAWEPKPDFYPNGWGPIMSRAKESGVTLGIWSRATDVVANPDNLNRLYDAGFRQFKIDIGSWSTYDFLHKLTVIARDLKKHSGGKAMINWDVTHKGLRVGYLFNREYGNLFLQNRRLPFENEGRGPTTHTYVPRRILKDQWRAADYLNLNQMLINVQTTEFVPPEASNARLYGDAYSFAAALMSAPLFFTETWRYSPADRTAVGNLIAVYKQHRVALYAGYVFSVGALPTDESWSGFQNYHPGKDSGYLTLFRGLNNRETGQAIKLRFLQDRRLRLENLLTGEVSTISVDPSGETFFQLAEPASFRFYRYQVLPN